MSELTLKQKKALYYAHPKRCATCNATFEYADRDKKYCNDICRGKDTKKYKDEMMRTQIGIIEQSIREGREIPHSVKTSLVRTAKSVSKPTLPVTQPATVPTPIVTEEPKMEVKPEPIVPEIVPQPQQMPTDTNPIREMWLSEAIREGKVIYAPIQMNVFIVTNEDQLNRVIDKVKAN